MPAFVDLAFVRDAADVNRVRQEFVDVPQRLCPADRANPDALRRALYQFLDHTLW